MIYTEEPSPLLKKGIRDTEARRTVLTREASSTLPELHSYQDALVRKGLEEMRTDHVVSHAEVIKSLKRQGALPSSSPRPSTS
jgi:hypothetical protein